MVSTVVFANSALYPTAGASAHDTSECVYLRQITLGPMLIQASPRFEIPSGAG